MKAFKPKTLAIAVAAQVALTAGFSQVVSAQDEVVHYVFGAHLV